MHCVLPMSGRGSYATSRTTNLSRPLTMPPNGTIVALSKSFTFGRATRVAKKAQALSGDRSDPKQNKSLAIRTVVNDMPKAKGSEVAAEVKKQFGHEVSLNHIYMVKTKLNIKASARAKAARA